MSGRISAQAFAVWLALLACPAYAEEPRPTADTEKPSAAEVAQWRKQLLDLRKEFFFGTDRKAQERWEEGRQRVAAIDDPAAVPAIVALLETEKHGQFRRALLQPLIALGGKESLACLVKWSVEDPNPYLRQDACHGLAEKKELPELLDPYLAYLQPVRQGRSIRFATETAEALTMTRLAAPLEEGALPNEQLVRLLAGALDSAPVFIKQTDSAPIKNFIPDPRDSKARQKRKTPLAGVLPVVETPNPVVLATLQEYTGEDFQYDKKAWLAWLEKRLAADGPRR